ncbi:choline/ethanolamine kinase-like isoform X3 [Watersipora subatra]|uniref:choline/ethanolamine kinase-like isoform X3 n=1 Tax=Watersipora subatra TaxID=2589382 RepID=UPI00355B1FAE
MLHSDAFAPPILPKLTSCIDRLYQSITSKLLSTFIATMTTQEEQMSKCVRLCQEHFGGAWHRVVGSQLLESAVKPLSGGLSNYLYIASLPEGIKVEGDEPKEVLLRFYGVAQGDNTTILKDSLVFALLSQRGLGPKFYGCFTEGRFEEYIPTCSLKTHEMAYPQYVAQIALKMAKFHLLDMPLCKEPSFFKTTVASYMDKVKKNIHKIDRKPLWKDICALNLDLDKEYNWLVGYDVANHFLEWCYCYAVTEPPYYSQCLDNYPSLEQQNTFFHHYLKACGMTPTDENMYELYLETQLFLLGPHFLWAMWSLASGLNSQMNFGYMEFALDRLKAYKNHKEYLQEHYPKLISIDE